MRRYKVWAEGEQEADADWIDALGWVGAVEAFCREQLGPEGALEPRIVYVREEGKDMHTVKVKGKIEVTWTARVVRRG